MRWISRFAILIASLSLFTSAMSQEVNHDFIKTTLVEDGKPIQLELLISKPQGVGPFPVVIFNHGSTGRGDRPDLFRQAWSSPAISKYFTDKGWMVVFPQRRGRGSSEGLYDEGFEVDRSRYSCLIDLSLNGVKRAVTDLDAVMEHIRARPDVLVNQALIGGQSRGGILAITYAGAHPDMFLGVVNFVGGWISDQCANATTINKTVFKVGSAFQKPTLWLYGERDAFYSLSHSKSNFDAFVEAGGKGSFQSYSIPGGWIPGSSRGHELIAYPDLWRSTLDIYIDGIR